MVGFAGREPMSTRTLGEGSDRSRRTSRQPSYREKYRPTTCPQLIASL